MIRFVKALHEVTVPVRPGDVVRVVAGDAEVKVVAIGDDKVLAVLRNGSSYAHKRAP